MKKNLIGIVCVLAVLFLACPPEELKANFFWSPAPPAVGQAVTFTSTSTGSPDSWSWTLGDGASASGKRVEHSYLAPGEYPVTLTVSAQSGQTKSTTKTISVKTMLAASFTYSPTYLEAAIEIQFTDTSAGSPTSWAWNFGDGTSSTLRNPKHTFVEGQYSIVLTVSDGSQSSAQTMNLTVAPELKADFSWAPIKPAGGQEVQFTDLSTGTDIVSWAWDFGDGGVSTLRNPKHTFINATGADKDFIVTLTITNVHGQTASLTAIGGTRR